MGENEKFGNPQIFVNGKIPTKLPLLPWDALYLSSPANPLEDLRKMVDKIRIPVVTSKYHRKTNYKPKYTL